MNITKMAVDLTETMVNGNISDAIYALEAMSSLQSAAVALEIQRLLETHHKEQSNVLYRCIIARI